MYRFNLIIPVTEYSSTEELDGQYKDLVKSAYEACSTSYAPYSKYCAGAAVLLENGEIIKGSNQENAAYPSGLCAERVAVFYANSLYPEVPVVAIAIAASVAGVPVKEPVYPCGSCRQSLLQSEQRFQKNIRVLMIGSEKIRMVESIKDLLPLAYELIIDN
ncbi:MAG: cytidine deaminase [Prevotellaceae bacterium]|jgi:cytidine deaminase|nr:cytidine deaminase [Prevotellaceae bacterium]